MINRIVMAVCFVISYIAIMEFGNFIMGFYFMFIALINTLSYIYDEIRKLNQK